MVIKVDTHVHANEKKIATDSFARFFHTTESYTKIEEVHKLAKKQGNDYVTITNHNDIEPSKRLVECFPKDSFMGCEYAVRASDIGHEIDVLCLGINEDAHKELAYLRKRNLKGVLRFCRNNKVAHSWAHPFCPTSNKLPPISPDQFNRWWDQFKVKEIKNGDLQIENYLAEIVAKNKGEAGSGENIAGSGGSDAHSIHGIGKTRTVAENASNLEEFLTEFREGRIYAEGDWGSIKKKSSEFYNVIWNYLKREKHWKKYLTLFSLLVPPVNIGLVAGALIIPYAKAVSGKIHSEEDVKNFAEKYFKHICQKECMPQQQEITNLQHEINELKRKQNNYSEHVKEIKSEYTSILNDLQRKSFTAKIPFFGRLILKFKKYKWYQWLFDLDY
jgi:predicted metal-dependent phosphoesterase TrpH